MARRPNYNHVKRQKELERQKKQEAKAEKKRLRKEGIDPTAVDAANEADEHDSDAEAESET